MTASIFVFDSDGRIRRLPPVAGDAGALTGLLLAHPELLEGVLPAGGPGRLLLVRAGDGAPGSAWPTGHLFLDEDGIATIVELRSADGQDERRAIVGEAVDLLAQAPHDWTAAALRAQAEGDPAGRERTAAFLEAEGAEAFWRRVEANLRAGRVRYLLVASRAPVELVRAMTLVGQGNGPHEAAVVEMWRFAGDGLDAYLPVAATEGRAKEEGDSAPEAPLPGAWDEAAFLADARERVGPACAAVLGGVLAWARGRAIPVEWGARRGLGSFSLVHASPAGTLAPVWCSSSGRIEVRLGRVPGMAPYQRERLRREMVERLRLAPEFEPPRRGIGGIVGLRAAWLRDPEALEVFLEAVAALFAGLRGGADATLERGRG